MKTTKEKQDWILENCMNEYGFIDLTKLDFSGQYVYLSGMKAKTIYQKHHEAGTIHQSGHKAKRIYQTSHKLEKVFEGKHTIIKPTQTFTLEEAIDAIAREKGIDKNKIELIYKQAKL